LQRTRADREAQEKEGVTRMTLEEKWSRTVYKLHRQDLKRRGISVEQAAQRSYEPMTPNEMFRESGQSAGNAIAITCYSANGKPRKDRRYRLLDPDKIAARGGKRYTQKKATGILIHMRKPEVIAKEYRKRRIFTEGEIKADTIAEFIKAMTISFPGVDCFKGKDGKLHPAIANLDWQGYTAEFAYDTDQSEKPQVRRALLECADELAKLGAAVQFREIPNVPNAEKTGADDVIQHLGAQAYINAPLHDLDSPLVAKWREACKKLDGDYHLPASMRNLEPVGAEWYDEDPPPPEYILQNYLQKNEVCLIAGQAGTSKSTWTMYAAVGMASGTKFFHQSFDRFYRTMYCMLERHKNSFRRRWRRIVQDVAEPLEEGEEIHFRRQLLSHFFAKPLAGENMNFIEYKNQQWVMTPLVDELIAELLSVGIEIMILDPISRLYGGEENGETFNALTKAFEYIVQKANCTIIFVHHAGKDATANGGKYAGRGASQLTDNTSETVSFSEYKGAEREKLGDLSCLREGEENADIIRVEHTRCSDGELTGTMYFVRLPHNGLLRPINIRRKDAGSQVDALLVNSVLFHKWAKGKQFSKTQFGDARSEIVRGNLSERSALALFDEAVTAGIFKHTGDRNGRPLYKLDLAPNPPPDNESGAVPRATPAPLRHSKKRGESHAD
jgi:hypothetical protein